MKFGASRLSGYIANSPCLLCRLHRLALEFYSNR